MIYMMSEEKRIISLIKEIYQIEINKLDNSYDKYDKKLLSINILLNYILDNKSLINELKNIKIANSDISHDILLKTICELNLNELTIDYFIKVLKSKLKLLKNKNNKKYEIFFLLNLKYSKPEYSFRKNIFDIFNLKEFSINDDYKIVCFPPFSRISFRFIEDTTELKKNWSYFSQKTDCVMIKLKFEDNKSTLNFLIENTYKNILISCGLINLSQNIYMNKHLYPIQDMNISNIKPISFFVIENDELIYPKSSEVIKQQIEYNYHNPKKLKIKNENYIKNYLNLKNRKDKIIECLNEFLIFYTDSCNQIDLKFSFLSFWILSERIIKSMCRGNCCPDERLKDIMKKIMVNSNDYYIEKIIDNLYSLRNDLVHEGKYDKINQKSRNLSKNITDEILNLFIKKGLEFKTMNDYYEYTKKLISNG